MARHPEYDRLFVLAPDFAQGEMFTCSVDVGVDEANSILRRGNGGAPLSARWKFGPTRPRHFAYVTETLTYLVSGRVLDEWRRHGLTGWSSVPCALVGRANRTFDDFHFLVVTGQSGPIDFDRGARVDVPFAYGTVAMRQGLYFANDAWDGSDVFMAPNYRAILVSERVRDCLSRLPSSPLCLEALSACQHPEAFAQPERFPSRPTRRRVLH